MNPIQTTLKHRILPPRAKSHSKAPAVIFLHGRGADENDLIGLSEYLDERLFLMSVRAPFAFSTTGGYHWFDIVDIGKAEPEMFNESYAKLTKFIEDAKKGYPIDPAKIFLFGFSMGTMMAYTVALTQPDSVKGIIANSGLIPESTGLKYEWEKIKSKPFFVGHGIHDSIVPVAFGKRAHELLADAGADVTYREYEMDHQIEEEGLGDIIKWMAKYL
jgi:phospholipase/carboxylesterase